MNRPKWSRPLKRKGKPRHAPRGRDGDPRYAELLHLMLLTTFELWRLSQKGGPEAWPDVPLEGEWPSMPPKLEGQLVDGEPISFTVELGKDISDILNRITAATEAGWQLDDAIIETLGKWKASLPPDADIASDALSDFMFAEEVVIEVASLIGGLGRCSEAFRLPMLCLYLAARYGEGNTAERLRNAAYGALVSGHQPVEGEAGYNGPLGRWAWRRYEHLPFLDREEVVAIYAHTSVQTWARLPVEVFLIPPLAIAYARTAGENAANRALAKMEYTLPLEEERDTPSDEPDWAMIDSPVTLEDIPDYDLAMERHGNGMSYRAIGRKYGLDHKTVKRKIDAFKQKAKEAPS